MNFAATLIFSTIDQANAPRNGGVKKLMTLDNRNGFFKPTGYFLKTCNHNLA